MKVVSFITSLLKWFFKWLKDKGKSVVAERFTRTLKNKIHKHMSAISKNVYFDVLNDFLMNTIIHTIKLLK